MARITHSGTGEGAAGDSEHDGSGDRVNEGRRDFLKGAMAAGGAAVSFAAA